MNLTDKSFNIIGLLGIIALFMSSCQKDEGTLNPIPTNPKSDTLDLTEDITEYFNYDLRYLKIIIGGDDFDPTYHSDSDPTASFDPDVDNRLTVSGIDSGTGNSLNFVIEGVTGIGQYIPVETGGFVKAEMHEFALQNCDDPYHCLFRVNINEYEIEKGYVAGTFYMNRFHPDYNEIFYEKYEFDGEFKVSINN